MANIWINGEVNESLLYEIQQQFESIDTHEDLYVYIDSPGGEVKSGYAIVQLLQQHKGNITTIATGLAGSIASVIYMMGNERLIEPYAMLFIHNAHCTIQGNQNELREVADKLEQISNVSLDIYESISNLPKETLKQMMDKETFISSDDCIKYGFSTGMYESESNAVVQSVKKSLHKKIFGVPKPANQVALNNLRKLK